MSEIYNSSHTGVVIDDKIQHLIDYGICHECQLVPDCMPLEGQETKTAPSYSTQYSWARYHVLGHTCFITFHLKITISDPGVGYAILSGLPYRSAYDTAFAVYEESNFLNHDGTSFVPSACITVQGGNNVIRLENDNGKTMTRWNNGGTWIGASGFYFIQI